MPVLALEFLILTAARTGEVLGARWQEIDFETQCWTIPAYRMKAGREHRVPLSDRATEILVLLKDEDQRQFVFQGNKQNKPISNMAMTKVIRRLGYADITVHGFRSTFRDWVSEETNFDRDLAEQALAHRIGDATELAYRRSDVLEKRRTLMAAWADFCKKTQPVSKNHARA